MMMIKPNKDSDFLAITPNVRHRKRQPLPQLLREAGKSSKEENCCLCCNKAGFQKNSVETMQAQINNSDT